MTVQVYSHWVALRQPLVLGRDLAQHLVTREATPGPAWSQATLAGRLTELSSHGSTSSLTAAVSLLLDAQRLGEPCAWVTRPSSTFFPPDVAASGVDLDGLVVVFTPHAHAGARAAARLVRSGGFGLVVVDVGERADIPSPLQGRLSALAREHAVALLLLTQKPASSPSLGSMVSLRLEARRTPLGDARFLLRLGVLKDKRHGPGWTHEEELRGPAGIR